MSAPVDNITICQGAVWSQSYEYKESDGTTPIDITGAYIAMQIRPTIGDSTVIETLTTSNGKITITDAVNGAFRIDLDANETELITQSGVYDIELSPGGDTSATVRLVQGSMTLSLEVTKV